MQNINMLTNIRYTDPIIAGDEQSQELHRSVGHLETPEGDIDEDGDLDLTFIPENRNVLRNVSDVNNSCGNTVIAGTLKDKVRSLIEDGSDLLNNGVHSMIGSSNTLQDFISKTKDSNLDEESNMQLKETSDHRRYEVSSRIRKAVRTCEKDDNRLRDCTAKENKAKDIQYLESHNIAFIPNESLGAEKEPKSVECGFDVTWETEKVSAEYWLKAEEEESLKAFVEISHLTRGNGIDTIFLIDTSASMRGEGMRQCKEAFQAIIEEIEEGAQCSNENVGVVTFGSETRVLQYPTCDYGKVRHSLDDIVCEKTSPLLAGIVMCGVIQKANGERVTSLTDVNWTIGPRIILITDGHITDHHYLNGPDDSVYYDTDEELRLMNHYLNAIGLKISCVPVGNANMELLETVAAITNGRVVRMPHVRTELGRYAVNVTLASRIFLFNHGLNCSDLPRDLVRHFVDSMQIDDRNTRRQEKDLEAIIEILSNAKDFRSEGRRKLRPKVHLSNRENPEMPPFGSRVRRGPDWRWGNQDLGSAGTIVGHRIDDFGHRERDWLSSDSVCSTSSETYPSSKKGWVDVFWDSGKSYNYRFGRDNAIDVVIVDEPRVLRDGENVAVGCVVERGPDWKWDNQDGGAGNKGSIYRTDAHGVVYVRWSDGHKSNYRFGHDGKYDVQICAECLPVETKKKSVYDGQQFEIPEKLASVKSTSIPPCDINDFEKPFTIKQSQTWQWRDSNGRWRTYSKQANGDIQRAYQKNPKTTVLVDIDGVSYRVVMERNFQINTVTKEKTEIRRT